MKITKWFFLGALTLFIITVHANGNPGSFKELNKLPLTAVDSILIQLRTQSPDSATLIFDQWMRRPDFSASVIAPAILYNRAVLARKKHQLNFADSLVTQIIYKYGLSASGFYKAQAYTILGTSARIKGNTRMSVSYLDSALSIYSRLDKSFYTANCYLNLGNTYLIQGNYVESLKNLHLSQNIADSMASIKGGILVRTSIIGVYRNLGLFDQAVDVVHEVQEMVTQLHGNDSLKNTMLVNHHLGLLHKELNNYDKALKHTKSALEVAGRLSIKNHVVAYGNNLSGIYLKLNKPDSALYYLNRSQLILTELSLTDFRVDINKAEAYLQLKNYKKAIKIIRGKEYSFIQKGRYNDFLNWVNLEAKINVAMGQPKKALKILLPHYKDSLASKYPRTEIEILKTLSMAAAQDRQFKSAYRFQKSYSELFEQQEKDNRRKADLKLNVARQLKDWQDERVLIQQKMSQFENELSTRKERNRLYLYSGTMLFILLSLATFFWNKSVKKDNELLQSKAMLAEQKIYSLAIEKNQLNETLSTQTKIIAGKNEIIAEIKSQVGKVLAEGANENERLVEKMVAAIDQKANGEKDWETFLLYFDKLYSGFIFNLKTQYQNLTTGEIRLCTLLIINLSTKEIAHVLGVSPSSANSARYRLRKKLGLNKNDDLIQKLNSIWKV